jgi:hypothetical protein
MEEDPDGESDTPEAAETERIQSSRLELPLDSPEVLRWVLSQTGTTLRANEQIHEDGSGRSRKTTAWLGGRTRSHIRSNTSVL